MGRSIYFSDNEISELVDASEQWCEMMCSGDEKCADIVQESLNNGLGSALRKLRKGTNGERIYKDYK